MTRPIAPAKEAYAGVPSGAAEDIARRFRQLADEWKSAVALESSTSAMVNHPAYRAIIALGPPVLPFLLRDLEREPAHWFEALRAVAGEDPVPREKWGQIAAMAEAWLCWGRSRHLI
jgi:hypothetical protein